MWWSFKFSGRAKLKKRKNWERPRRSSLSVVYITVRRCIVRRGDRPAPEQIFTRSGCLLYPPCFCPLMSGLLLPAAKSSLRR